ncbi:MAG: glycoside hydrolase family 3 C-terminal domain-containing protein [Defluviitaleaceae bacterium]|nr:glycoside hydrolase family 3 C-terminal domain-containing protein [Defluviitaleaceae bacterium]
MNPPYKNPSLPATQRAADLISRMTIREKVGQLNQKMYGWQAYESCGDGTFQLTAAFKAHVQWGGGMGALYGLFRADPWSKVTVNTGISKTDRSTVSNMVQQYIKDHTRLGIPVLLSEETPHGHQAIDGAHFPTNIGMGCAFNPALLAKLAAFTAKTLRASGAHLALVSLLDMAIDPRWGRTEECFSEDPYLSARMAAAAVQGFHENGAIAVAKHFCGQGAGLGGHNAHAANIGERELREIHMPAMVAAVKAGLKACMVSYNEIDGIPNHANDGLLKDILRDELGFTGIVMADGCGIDALAQLTGDVAKAGALALASGVDLSLWDDGFTTLEQGLSKGWIDEAMMDTALERILTLKFELGLFEECITPSTTPTHHDALEEKALHIEAALESAVLLKNDSTLPLSKRTKVALIGPNANNLYNQLGDYSAPQRPGTGSTLLEGMQSLGAEVKYAQGCAIRNLDTSGFEEAIRIADWADVVILALGGCSTRNFNDAFADNGAIILEESAQISEMDCGEGVDLADLNLGGVQNKLLQQIKSHVSGKPIVTVLIQGRPHVINDVYDLSNAVLSAWYPGKYGGDAVAQLLFGDANPSGKLSVSIPRSSAQLPVYYNHKPGAMSPYADMSEKPLLPFGYGLSYTAFAYENASLSTPHLALADLQAGKKLVVSVDVTNTGTMPGAEVVQVYVRDVEATIKRRVKELKGFNKVFLRPGETHTVSIELDFDAFALWDRQMEYVVEQGNFEIGIGRDSEDYMKMGFTVGSGFHPRPL